MSLRDKVAVVTGGAVRLGQAMSLALAERGMRVCVHYGHSAREAEATVARIMAAGGRAVAVRGDLAAGAGVAADVMAAAANAFGRVDVLVNSAAIFEADGLGGVTESGFDRHVAINLRAPLFLCQAFVAQLAAAQEAQIVNIVDWRALRPRPGHLSYTMTKSALVALTKMLALELAPQVRVNAIAPGAILLPADAPPSYRDQLTARIPLKTMGTPLDITRALVYLLESDFLTGEVLCVSGGEGL